MTDIELSIPQVLRDTAMKYGDGHVAFRQKKLGIWRTYTWKAVYEHTKHFACGLAALGFYPGNKVAIIGDNAPEWLFAMFAAMSLKGVSTGASPQGLASEIEFCVNHSEARFVVLQDQEQVDKFLLIRDRCPNVVKALYWDCKGMRSYTDPILMSFADVEELGRQYEKEHPGFYETILDSTNPDESCAINYTSGTTGVPKGALYSSRTLLTYSISSDAAEPLDVSDKLFSLVPLWTIGDLTVTFLVALRTGSSVAFPEKPETLPNDLREISPARQVVAPRWLEAQISQIQVGIINTIPLKRFAYKLLMPIGTKVAAYRCQNLRPPLMLRLAYRFANLVLFRPLRDFLGYVKTRTLICTGAAVSAEVFSYFLALGLRVLNGYGMAEVGIVSLHRRDDIDPATAGVPVSGAQVRITDDSEIVVKPPAAMLGYYNDPTATAKFRDQDGWLHTGDAGYIDEKGHLVCIDRVSDLMKLSDGTSFSPQFIEGKVKFSPYVSNAIIVGDEEAFVGAMICMDFANVCTWAESNRIPYTTYVDLSQRQEVYDLIRQVIDDINKQLPPNQRIRRFLMLHKELDADDAEVTRTMKLRRRYISELYKDMVQAIYGDKEEIQATVDVKYRDGKVRQLQTSVKILHLKDNQDT